MPRSQFSDVAGYTNPTGGAFTLVTTTRCTVYVAVPYAGAPLTTLASLFSSESGAGTPGNPFNATTGEVNFWAAPGSYDIKIEDTGSPAKFATRVIRWDAIAGDQGVLSQMIADGTIVLADLAAALQTTLLTPTGAVLSFAGASAPTGFLLCDGLAVSRSTYAALFAAIGTTFGNGDGSTTFNVPDLRGRVVVGVDGAANRLTASDTLGASAGEEKHTIIASELPAHAHRAVVSDPSHSHPPAAGTSFIGDSATVTGFLVPGGSSGKEVTQASTTAAAATGITATVDDVGQTRGGAANNMQPYSVMNYIIRT